LRQTLQASHQVPQLLRQALQIKRRQMRALPQVPPQRVIQVLQAVTQMLQALWL